MRRLIGLLLTTLLAAAAPALAQEAPAAAAAEIAAASTPAPQAAPVAAAAPAHRISVRGYGIVDLEWMQASQSFDALFGSSRMTGFGAGADVLNVWRKLFIRAAVTHMSKDGTRAFVYNNQVFSLGIPMTVTMTPFEVGAGWTLMPATPDHRLSTYLGAAALFFHYAETSEFAAAGDNVNTTYHGYEVFGGAEYDVLAHVLVGAEAQYRGVPNAIGQANTVSGQFNESNLGGFAVRILFGARF